jgi:hypothetical protein
MKTMKIAAAVLVVMVSLIALGQNAPTVGSLLGTVRDAVGNVMPGVAVTVTGLNGSYRAVTNERGDYTIQNVRPGNYVLAAELRGFENVSQQVSVAAGSPTPLSLTMQIASQKRPQPYPGQGTSPNIRADRQTQQGAITQYRGNVIMSSNGMEIRADELDYDTWNGTGDVRGNVKFRMTNTVRTIPLSN